MSNDGWSDFEKHLISEVRQCREDIKEVNNRLTSFQIKVYSSVFVLAGVAEGIKWLMEFKR